jgi:PEP-CTERM motif
MKTTLAAAAALLATVYGMPLRAAQIASTQTGIDTTWVNLDDSNLTSINDDDPVTTLVTIAPGTVVNGVPSTFNVNENNFGSGIAGQSFLATKGGKIGHIQMRVSGGPGNYDVHLYDAGAGFPAGGPMGGTNYGDATTSNFTDMLPADSWFKFFGSGSSGVYTLDFRPHDVNLTAGNTYIFEVVASQERDANGVKFGPVTAGSGVLTWYRNGGTNTYLPYGQAFRDRTSLNGNPDRSFAMAVAIVPEPATAMMLLSVGLVAIVSGRRRTH